MKNFKLLLLWVVICSTSSLALADEEAMKVGDKVSVDRSEDLPAALNRCRTDVQMLEETLESVVFGSGKLIKTSSESEWERKQLEKCTRECMLTEQPFFQCVQLCMLGISS